MISKTSPSTVMSYTFVSAAVEMVPQNYVKLESEEDIKNMEKLIDIKNFLFTDIQLTPFQ